MLWLTIMREQPILINGSTSSYKLIGSQDHAKLLWIGWPSIKVRQSPDFAWLFMTLFWLWLRQQLKWKLLEEVLALEEALVHVEGQVIGHQGQLQGQLQDRDIQKHGTALEVEEGQVVQAGTERADITEL